MESRLVEVHHTPEAINGGNDGQLPYGTQNKPKDVEEPVTLPPGVARIKPQYIVTKRPRNSTAEALTNEERDSLIDPPPKKKSRGQNKYRPPVKIPYSSQLCPSFHIGSHKECSFGDKCRYLHDIPKFLREKPPDISNECYLFNTFGYCPSGLACRYGNSHIKVDEGVSMINEMIYQPDKGPNKVLNTIPRTLQEELRKRKVPFPRTSAFLKQLKLGNSRDKTLLVTGSSSLTANEDDTLASSDERTVDAAVRGETVKDENMDATGKEEVITTGSNGERDNPLSASCVSTELDKVTESDNNSQQSKETYETAKEACRADDGCKKGVVSDATTHPIGPVSDEDVTKLRQVERKKIDFRDKLYLAPLTTVGNLPFRRICKRFGADITCSEMALSINLLQGQQSEWALLKRHPSEDLFGVQVCGSFPDTMARCAELISNKCSVDFVDINVGCPIDLIFKKGAGCALMQRKNKFQQIVTGMSQVLDIPLTVKMRTGVYDKNWNAHKLIPELREWGASLVTIHGRSREQRYTKLSDWEYIDQCAKAAAPMPLFGNGDILSFEDYSSFRERASSVSGTMIARGALIKPWIFTEIKEQRHWDISSSERLDIVKEYVHYGLEHWGSDTQGIERTRRFLLEWLSFLHRYIPYGLLEKTQRINERPPYFVGRNELETMMASRNCQDWIKITEMFLGPIPENFSFLPKHKANSYS